MILVFFVVKIWVFSVISVAKKIHSSTIPTQSMIHTPPSAVETSRRSDGWRLGIIILLVLISRIWVIGHTTLPSRDTFTFIRSAMQFETPPPNPSTPDRQMTRKEVIRHHVHPPGYPIIVLIVSQPVRSILGTNADSLVLSTQIASLLAAILLTFPMYYLGKCLWDQRTAFVATLLFQSLPVWCRITSDGLSDGWFLCFAATGLWMAASGFKLQSRWRFFIAGICFGCAYLMRPEGLILFGTCGVMILGQLSLQRREWKAIVVRGTALTIGGLLIAMPYIMTIRKLTNKPSGNIITDKLAGEDVAPPWEHDPEVCRPAPTFAFFAAWRTPGHPSPLQWSFASTGSEILKSAHYVIPFLALLGIYLSRKQIREEAAYAYLVFQIGVYLAALIFLASTMGYVSERHTLTIVFLGCYFAVAAIPFVGSVLARLQITQTKYSPATFSFAFTILLFATSYPLGFKHHHATREGHLAAGRWLAEHASPEDGILDPYLWAEFYATKEFNQDPDRLSKLGVKTVFIVAEPNSPKPTSQMDYLATAQNAAQHGKVVFTWSKGKPRYEVVIYRWDPKEK